MKKSFEPYSFALSEEAQKNLSFLEFIQRNNDTLNELGRDLSRVSTQVENLSQEFAKISEIVRWMHDDILELKVTKKTEKSFISWILSNGWPIGIALISFGAFIYEFRRFHGLT